MTRLVPAAVVLAAASVAGAQTLTTVIDNGPSGNRADIVFLGDGYLAEDLDTTYATHVANMTDYLFNARADTLSDPYPRYRNFFNVHKVDLASNERGADIPTQGIYVDTALNATFSFGGGPERLLYIDSGLGFDAQQTALFGTDVEAEIRFVTVNTSKYGGGGGYYGVYAGANGASLEVALHEAGHSFNGLADEYGSASGNSTYTGSEPREINVTTDPTGAKWSHWLGYEQEGIGTIGVYEGGRYHEQGIYRPSEDSKMRSLNNPFDAVSREKIILDIYDLVDPIDAFTDNAVALLDPELIELQLIDTDVQDVEWTVDGLLVTPDDEEVLDVTALDLAAGEYTVSARVFDPTEWVRIDRDKLEQTVTWTLSITAVPEPASLAVLGVTLLGLRRRR